MISKRMGVLVVMWKYEGETTKKTDPMETLNTESTSCLEALTTDSEHHHLR